MKEETVPKGNILLNAPTTHEENEFYTFWSFLEIICLTKTQNNVKRKHCTKHLCTKTKSIKSCHFELPPTSMRSHMPRCGLIKHRIRSPTLISSNVAATKIRRAYVEMRLRPPSHMPLILQSFCLHLQRGLRSQHLRCGRISQISSYFVPFVSFLQKPTNKR